MAYYSGLCTSYRNLTETLVEKCQVHGWVWQDNILSKDDLFIKIEPQDTTRNNIPAGIILTGGTNRQNFVLGSSGSRVRMGSPHPTELGATFPANYHLFIFANEVYLIIKFDYDKFFYLAFGKSTLIQGTQGNGLWLSATSNYYANLNNPIVMTELHGGHSTYGFGSAVAPFWNRHSWSQGQSNSLICHGFDGILWSLGNKKAHVIFEPLITRLPTAHFSDSPLLPYNIYLERPENKLSLIAQLENARFVRVDNYENEQILTLGHEKWMIFPFYHKNIRERSNTVVYYQSGKNSPHTGTFGWAIRYDG